MSKKLWGGRFEKPTDASVEAYTASIHFDFVLTQDDIQGSLAHAAMLLHCKLITPAEYEEIKQGLHQLAEQYAKGELAFHISDEDIHMNIERALFNLIGDTAKKLHTARSRNDQVALDIHLYLRRQIISITRLLQNLQATLVQLAEDNKEVILPGYTHLQRAQPIYFSTHCLAYFSMFGRDIARLQDLWLRVNISPLGAGALAGSSLPIDPVFTASLLGFDQIYSNTLDAVSDRDFIIEFLSAASLIMLHISRLSEELILWASQEFNFISFDDAYSTGSSMMPQKKNPDVAELARGKTGRVYGSLITLLTLQKSLPLAYNKDMQEDKEPLFDTVNTLINTLTLYSPMLKSLTINDKIMRSAVNSGYVNATTVAEYLVKAGMPFRSAHEITGKMVAYCIENHCRLEDLSYDIFLNFSPLFLPAIYEVLHIENCVEANDKGNYQKQSRREKELFLAKNKLNDTTAWIEEKEHNIGGC